METEIRLRLMLRKPPAGVDFALQKGHGRGYEPFAKQRSNGQDLSFDFTVEVKPGPAAAAPRFAGPFVQGPAGDKFFYVDIGTYAGQTDSRWSRKLKVPLSSINRKMIAAGQILEAEIPGTGKDGGPSCAYEWRRSVGPDWGWKIVKQSRK